MHITYPCRKDIVLETATQRVQFILFYFYEDSGSFLDNTGAFCVESCTAPNPYVLEHKCIDKCPIYACLFFTKYYNFLSQSLAIIAPMNLIKLVYKVNLFVKYAP